MELNRSGPSRRALMQAAAAAAVVAGLAPGAALAQTPPKHRRPNINSPAGAKALASYQKAITAMLALPPTDPRNWYRNALTHTVDCPHGNWWFLVWHRGYIGWFEQICRELSGDPDFVLPYWDWTANLDPSKPFAPCVPEQMYEGVLTPEADAFIPSFARFHDTFGEVVGKLDWWTRAFDAQGNLIGKYGQLLARGVRFPDDLWFDIEKDPRGLLFFQQASARGLPKDAPQLDAVTTKAVSLPTLLDALSPRDFITFASAKTYSHSGLTGFGILEGQPHNNVHNCVGGAYNGKGGFMQANLSPVDPLFFLHHANIDRLWDVWTRKQQARNYPTLPEGADLGRWQAEPFLFFVDAKGNPVAQAKAGDYQAIGAFDYDYEPGSGEQVVGSALLKAVARPKVQRFAGQILSSRVDKSTTAGASIDLPQALLGAAAPGQGDLFAEITVSLPPLSHGTVSVLVGAPPGADSGPSSPYHVATLAMFGHHTVHGPVTFTVPLSTAVAGLRAKSLLKTNAPLNITLAAGPGHKAAPDMADHMLHGAAPDDSGAELLSVTIKNA
jgi:tyrosinase